MTTIFGFYDIFFSDFAVWRNIHDYCNNYSWWGHNLMMVALNQNVQFYEHHHHVRWIQNLFDFAHLHCLLMLSTISIRTRGTTFEISATIFSQTIRINLNVIIRIYAQLWMNDSSYSVYFLLKIVRIQTTFWLRVERKRILIPDVRRSSKQIV